MLECFFPVEVIHRELDFRVVSAVRFVQPGRRIYLGQHSEMMWRVNTVRGGLFVGRAFNPGFPHVDMTDYHTLRERGFAYVHLDEEGAVLAGGPDRWKQELHRRLDPTKLSPVDTVVTWGDFQRDVYSYAPASQRAHLATTGHPRFDLYKQAYRDYYQADADALRARFGDFVLINTNLAVANNGIGPSHIFRAPAGYHPEDPAKRLDYIDYWKYSMQALIAMIRLITRLTIEYPNTRFVIRPHPSENQGLYEAIFKDVKNATVAFEGSVSAWLIACRALVHDGCTTGIEAALADVPIVRYQTYADPRFEQFLPNSFGASCLTEDDAIAAVGRALEQTTRVPTDFSGLDPQVTNLMANFSGDSFERFDAALNDTIERSGVRSTREVAPYQPLARAHRAVEAAKRVVRPFTWRASMQKYAMRKFIGFNRANVVDRIERAQKILGRKVRYRQLSDALVVIDAD